MRVLRITFYLLLLSEGVLGKVTYKDVKTLIDTRCAICHKGPYLDLQSFPFYSDTFFEQEALLEEMIRKVERTDLKRMPPASYPPLEPTEVQLLKDWLADGVAP